MSKTTDAFKKFGISNADFERKNMTLWDVPQDINMAIPALPNKIYTNKAMVAPLEEAFRSLIAAGITEEFKTWDGCFNPRPVRGYEDKFKIAIARNDYTTASRYMSMHYWALAVDMNAAWNQLGHKPTLSEKFVKCFTDAGFDWGGNFTRLDGMHFELASVA